LATAEEKNSPSRSEPLQGLESPFLDRELFIGQGEEEWQAHMGVLEAESAFQSAFERPWAQPSVGETEGPGYYEPSATEWSPEVGGEQQTEDLTGVDYEQGESQLLDEQLREEWFHPAAVPQDVVDALGKQDWPLALKLAIEAGWRDENELTNLIFFARHPELPKETLEPENPKFKQLSAEWTKILNEQVWKTIEASSENTDLVVSGKEVTDHHRSFFRGKSGQRLRKLVEDAAREVDLNPGLLGTIMMAETRRPLSYLSSDKVSSYHVGCDDFYEAQPAIKTRVPANAKVRWDRKQTPVVHYNDAKVPRSVKTILFDNGPAAALATAVYVKFREVRLREIASESGQDFDSLPLPTRFALTRMAMAAGTGGATPYLKNALNGVDIFVRKAIPVRAYQTQRNATVRTAQAMHLSDWIFGIRVATVSQPEVEKKEIGDQTEANAEGEERWGYDLEHDNAGLNTTEELERGTQQETFQPFAEAWTENSTRYETNVTPQPAFELSEPLAYEVHGSKLTGVFEPYRIEGGLYSAKEKIFHAQGRRGLILTASVVGKEEAKLALRGPSTVVTSKEMTRFEGNRLGEFVANYNEFTHYFGEVLRAIGRLRDLLSAGAPEAPTDMTPAQKFALRPTDDRQITGEKKRAYRDWREAQAKYAAADGVHSLVFEVPRTGRHFDDARQTFWEAQGTLSRTIAQAKRDGKPKFKEIELKFSDLVSVALGVTGEEWKLVVLVADKVREALKNKAEYEAKLKEFSWLVKNIKGAIQDQFEEFRRAGATYWTELEIHRETIADRDKARIEARRRAADFGQAIAPHSESRLHVLAAIRMPALVSDAWRALAIIGPPALAKLTSVLASRSLIDRATFHYQKSKSDPFGVEDITNIIGALKRAESWKSVLTKDDVDEWVAMNNLWEETFNKFDV
jgi:hypothetical protein